ncbi:TPM domain-containing protein [Schaalia dentiphila]|uniref:TPM domain-containing protein n=1 Tax=Schaalia dentiphila TaxID=3050224 RepID=UPI002852CBA4|nr:TPM domain-containing protein [Schaalia sp. C24]
MVYVDLFATSQEDPVTRIRRFSLIAVLTAILLALGLPALAASPMSISDSVTDPDSWLSSADRSSIESSTSRAASSGKPVKVVVVANFSGTDADSWCKQTVERSSLTNGTVVYVIAYSQRRDAACSYNGPSSSSLQNAVRASEAQLTPNPLTSSAVANGVNAFVNTLVSGTSSSASSSTSSSHSTASGATNDDTGSLFGMFVMFLLLVGGVIAVAIGVARSSRRNRLAAQQAAQVDAESAARAAQEANRQLLSADEQVRTATDELNYARAQFGLSSTDEFARAIEAGKAAVSRGFSAQGQMNSATLPAEQLRLATAIMRDLGANMNPLSAIQASFATKRAEQASLPERIAEARERLAEELTDLERAKSELASISALYPAQMLASLQDNPEQASALLTSARTALDTAEASASTDRAHAASALDTALRALTMANHQTDAIFSAKSDLDAIRDRLVAAISSISSDITDVNELHTDPAVFNPMVADAHAAIAEAQAALANTGDPLAALEHLRMSEATLDAALEPLRTKEEAYEKTRAAAEAQISLAESAVSQAQRYVQGRRGAIDLELRSTLNNAEAALSTAHRLLEDDPESASSHAMNARALADNVMATPIQNFGGSWGQPSSGNGSYTGSSLGDFLLWSTLFSNSGSHHRDDFDPFHSGSSSSGSGWSFASGGGSDWGSSSSSSDWGSGGWSSASGSF